MREKKSIGNLMMIQSKWWPYIMLQIKAQGGSECYASTHRITSSSCMQSSKANREFERRFAVARHEPNESCVVVIPQIPTHPPEKLACISFSPSPQQCTPSSSTDHGKTAETCRDDAWMYGFHPILSCKIYTQTKQIDFVSP
jgi:hypothetical protein